MSLYRERFEARNDPVSLASRYASAAIIPVAIALRMPSKSGPILMKAPSASPVGR